MNVKDQAVKLSHAGFPMHKMINRLPVLDGLRGIAAIAVVVYHIGQSTGVTLAVPFGFLAVDLFFMMSGFVITRTYEDRISRQLSVRKFMLLRIARLYPVLLFSVIAAIAVHSALGRPPTPTQVFGHLALIPNFSTPNLYPLNPVLWSLLFEVLLNLGHGMAARHLTVTRVCSFTMLAGAGFAFVIWQYHGAGVGWNGATFLAGFARAGWGYGTGMVIARVALHPPRAIAWGAIATATVLLLAPPVNYTAVRVLATLFVFFPLATAAATLISKTCLDPFFGWIGGLSYPLYAIHAPILLLAAFGPKHSFVYWSFVTTAIIIFSAAVEKFYDAPLRRVLKRTLERRSDHIVAGC